MKPQTVLIALVLPATAAAFVVGPHRAPTFSKHVAPRFVATWADDNSDFLNKIPDIPTAKKEKPKPKEPEPAAPAPAPIPSATAPIGVSAASESTSPSPEPVVAPPKPQAKAVAPAPAPASSNDLSGGDLPIPIIAGGALAAFAAATFAMRGNVDEREASQSGTSTPAAAASGDDVSIPYHAAAQLAYSKSDKSMPYDKFQEKYEADAVAEVKAKQK